MRKLIALIWIGLIVLILLPRSNAVVGCNYCGEIQWGYSDGEFDRYVVKADYKTAGGTPYDPSGMSIATELIDRLTNEVNSCLTAAFPTGNLPSDVISSAHCYQRTSFLLPIDKTEFIVKVASDWVLNCDGTQQLLPTPVKAGPSGCIAKGQTPDAQCPCRWRAGIQCLTVLIVTPSFYLYKDVLIRFVTGCQNPWGNTQLATCATPSTTPLSDRTDPNNGL